MERLSVRRVLCPVQLQEFSAGVLKVGSALAMRYDADLFAIHVLERSQHRTEAVRRAGGRPSPQEAAIRLRGLIRTNSALDPRDVTSVVRHGTAGAEILAYASGMAADLIVVGRNLPTRWPRTCPGTGSHQGTAALEIAPNAPCPILTVGTVGEELTAVPSVPAEGVFKHIVCGVDFSETSPRVLSHAIALAHDAGGVLTIAHVLQGQDREAWPRNRERLVQRLYDLVGRRVRPGRSVHEIIAVGLSGDELLKLARHKHADLMVLGATYGGERDDPHSPATLVLQQAECPVLLVPRDPDSAPSLGGRLAGAVAGDRVWGIDG